MDTAATCKYYVTKLLGISPPKPNCVYDVRSGNVRNREQKSLFRVFYRSNGKRRKHRPRANTQESYAPSTHAEEVGAKIGDRHALEEDTVEDIEKKFLGFRNVFEKCKVKKKKPSRLYNVSSGLRFTLVANTMLIDSQKKGKETTAGIEHAAGNAIEENDAGEESDGEDDDDDDDEDYGNDGGFIEGDDEVDEEREEGEDSTYDDATVGAAQTQDAVENDASGELAPGSKCPKDVADKVNSWIDSSVKQTEEYSEEENLFVNDEEVIVNDLSRFKYTYTVK